jgi:hypothetical protein
MSALTVNGDLNIMGKFRINGEPLNTGSGSGGETFDNKITGDLQFLENKVMHGTITGWKEDDTHLLKLKSEKIVVDGDLEVVGAGGPVSITTEEQATGEKFLGRDMYVRGWEGNLDESGDTAVGEFFPSGSCRLVSYGGSSYVDEMEMTVPIPNGITEYNFVRDVFTFDRVLVIRVANCQTSATRIWVKYTHD